MSADYPLISNAESSEAEGRRSPKQGLSGTARCGPSVNFTYGPLTSYRQDVYATLDDTLEATARKVAKHIPALQRPEVEQLCLGMPVATNADGLVMHNCWGKITEETWAGILANPPKRMSIYAAKPAHKPQTAGPSGPTKQWFFANITQVCTAVVLLLGIVILAVVQGREMRK